LFAPATNDTLICPAATLTAVTLVGGAGEPTMTASDEADAKPAPREFAALTAHVYIFPVVKAVTTTGLAVPFCERVTPALLDVHVTE
jgi:hypothetical protein